MRRPFVLGLIFGTLAALALNGERGLERDIHDDPVAPTPNSLGGGSGLYEQSPQLGSVPVNRTEGSPRSGKHESKNVLNVRQTNVSHIFVLISHASGRI